MRAISLLLLTLLFLCVVPSLRGQEYHDLDSLWLELKRAKPDTNKVWIYISLGQQFETNNPDSALALYESALNLSRDLKYTRGMISYYTNATYVYNLKGQYDTALTLNLRSVELAKAFGNPERLSACLGNVAASYILLDMPEKAIEISLEILPLLEKNRYAVNYAIINENLSMLYNEISQPEKAKMYGEEALRIFKVLKNDYGIVNVLNNLSIAHINMGEPRQAMTLLNEAQVIARRTNNQYSLMATSLNLSNANLDLGNYEAVKSYCEHAYSLAKKLADPMSELIALRGLAIYSMVKNDPDEAENYAMRSLRIALDNESLKHAGKAYSVLSEIALLKKDFHRSRVFGGKSDSIRNVLLNESIAKNIQNMEAKYESEKKELRIRDLQQEAAIKDLSIQRNRWVNAALVGSLFPLLVIVFLGRHNYRQKKKLLMQENNVQEAKIAQLESEKQVLAGEAVIKGQEEERARLARDLHDGLGGLLSGVKFSFSNLKSNVALDGDNLLMFERSLDMLDHSITELRRVAHNMMPEVLLRFGLSEALKSYCDSLRTSELFRIDFQSVGMDARLPEKTEIFVFRIIQELLNNVVKHARASYVLVQIARDENRLSITVEDDGTGFEQNETSRGAGLASVQSRIDYLKGEIDIQSRQGRGTSVYVTVPV